LADQAKIGRNWESDELDAIVADYFAMLALEREGQAYVKSRRAADLMAQIGRTHRQPERVNRVSPTTILKAIHTSDRLVQWKG
jgi:hypothetical protein